MKYQNLINEMTLEEKASLVSGKDFWQTQNIDRLGIPSIFLADGPHGIRKQAAAADHLGLNESIKATCFPTAATMANSWNLELGKEMGECLSVEAKQQKVNILLGPGINIKRNPKCGRNFEYFSEDPYLAGKMASRYIQGIQTEGISGCVKHFACNNQELRRMTVDSVMDERTLREIYLTNFEIAIKEGQPKCIMSSYNLVNGEYANENKHNCNDILRGEWGYDGIMVSDWGGANNHVEGLLANNELEMPTTDGDTTEDVINAIKEGRLEERVLDENVDRLLNIIFETDAALKAPGKELNVDEHHLVAQKCAEESLVLLENDGVLPLKKEDKVAFIGKFIEEPRYQGAGSSVVNPHKLDRVLDSIKEYEFEYVGYEPGFDFTGKVKKGLIKKAVELANKADKVVVFAGLDNVTEAEGIDRKNILLPEGQLALIDELLKLNKKVIVCLSCGSVVELPFAKKVNGLLHHYLTGQAGAKAILNILTGEVNPSGKLAETYPLHYEDTPSYNYFHKKENTAEYRESIYVGYRYFEKVNKEVLYPFGYGLSYTKFAYSDLNVSNLGVTFKLKNVGDVEGKEIAQMYIGLKDSKIFRAVKELKGFVKEDLKPGEEKEVFIPFDDYSFRYFNVKTNKWEVEEGEYTIYVGSSSKDIHLTGSIHQKGTTDVLPYDEEKLSTYYTGDPREVNDEQFKELLGRDIPDGNIKFYKKKRIVVDYFTTVEQLRYSKRWVGRLFSWAIRFAIKFLRFFGNPTLANTLVMGVQNQPMRALSRMTGGAIHWKQLDGLIMVFNGHFFKGLKKFFKEGSAIKKQRKAEAKAKEVENNGESK